MEIILLALLILTAHSAHIIATLPSHAEDTPLNTYRLLVVQNNLHLIQQHNSDPTQTYTLKPNPHFIGFTEDEIK